MRSRSARPSCHLWEYRSLAAAIRKGAELPYCRVYGFAGIRQVSYAVSSFAVGPYRRLYGWQSGCRSVATVSNMPVSKARKLSLDHRHPAKREQKYFESGTANGGQPRFNHVRSGWQEADDVLNGLVTSTIEDRAAEQPQDLSHHASGKSGRDSRRRHGLV